MYGSYAVNLVKSLKAYEPTIKVCLVHDNKAIDHLTPSELGLFDVLKEAGKSDYTIDGRTQYQRMKLCVYDYTPFENTLYIDVDTLWFPDKPVNTFIDNLLSHDFYIGKNGDYNALTRKKQGSNYTFWGEPFRICRYFGIKNKLPQTISGVFWFKKSEFCDKLFKRALEIYADKKAPTQKWANGKADEYCFNVALAEMNYSQENLHVVYFDKSNGKIDRAAMYRNFWGIAAGGNRLSIEVRSMYEDLVDMYDTNFGHTIKRRCPDKAALISERRNY